MSAQHLSGIVGCALLVAVQAAAIAETATKVTLKDDEGRSETILIGESMARMGTGEAGEYMLIELNGPHIYHVDEERRSIFEMSRNAVPKTAPAVATASRLVKQGAGPEIAGYATDHYRLSVAQTHCGDIFVSRAAFEVSGIEPVYRATLEMAQQAKAMTAGFGAMGGADVCESADDLLMEDLEKYGMLMRSLDRNGGLETEVVTISEGVTVAPGSFDLPEGFERTDMNRQMRESAEMMQQLPDMQQIQELGRMSPEARDEAIRLMQEQLRAIQQQ